MGGPLPLIASAGRHDEPAAETVRSPAAERTAEMMHDALKPGGAPGIILPTDCELACAPDDKLVQLHCSIYLDTRLDCTATVTIWIFRT